MSRPFVHLHNHSEFSLLDGAARVKDMVERAYELGMPALALTDHGYMYGAMHFYRAALNAGQKNPRPDGSYGIKPILGCEIYFTPDSTLARDRKPELYHMVLLAKSNEGYKNLMHICSESAVKGFYYKPRTTIEMLRDYHEGILATSACLGGIIPQLIDRHQEEDAYQWAEKFTDVFGRDDFYIELQDHGIKSDGGLTQHEMNVKLNTLARDLNIKTVATNDMHYLHKEDARVQDALICIGTNKKLNDANRMKFENNEFYMKSPEQMYEIFEQDFPEALANTVEIADKCNVNIRFGDVILPKIPLPPQETNESMLRKESIKGLTERYGDLSHRPDVMDRFEHEYKIICEKGFAAYFLIVQDFTRWAKENGIGVGPGRGSAAGSIISYALGITAFDPLENGLIFERFLSPERTEMPDIDMDFDDERRDEVIDYVRKLYGHEKVAHVITYSTIKAKQAINDACRILDQPVHFGQRLSKMISSAPKVTLAETLSKSEKNPEYYNPDFEKEYKENEEAREVIDVARWIEGLTRGEGVHASAVIICRDPIYDHVPTKYDTKGGIEITQYDHVVCADLGLLKMDFLGLRTLTVINTAKRYIKENHGVEINEADIPFDAKEIFELFWAGKTEGVFQVESAGMTALLKRMRPTEYKHIVAVLALYRPGPLNAGMVDDYVMRMSGKKQVHYYDDRLRPILEDTYGTIVYQEQVMQISVTMSGFSLGESDRLRKAVAKKKVDLMREVVQTWEDGATETMEDHWINGAVRNGYDRQMAIDIWNDVLAFAEYAFNKSHSAAYGILTLQTAWLKANYPHEYMAAVLTSYTGRTEKIVHYISACRREGIPILPPDVNVSRSNFTAVAEGVRFGLAGIRGVGEGVVEEILRERDKRGSFKDLFDFIDRMDGKLVTRSVIAQLIKAGAFDFSGYTRQHMVDLVDKTNPNNYFDTAQRRRKERSTGQISMFDLFDDNPDLGFVVEKPTPHAGEWDRRLRLNIEKEVLGIYVTDHPLKPIEHALVRACDHGISAINEGKLDGSEVPDGASNWYAGMVSQFTKRVTRNGDPMATIVLEDMSGQVDVVVFPKLFKQSGELLMPRLDETGREQDEPVVRIFGRLERSDRGDQIIASKIEVLKVDDRLNRPRVFEVTIPANRLSVDSMARLSRLFEQYRGADRVDVYITTSSGKRYQADVDAWVDSKSPVLLALAKDMLGDECYVCVVE